MNKRLEILVVDDEPNIVEGLKDLLLSSGYQVYTASTLKQAKRILDSSPVDILLTDLKLGREDGSKLALSALEKHPELYVFIMTAYGSVEGAVEALKKGVYDYLTKPLKSDELLIKLSHIRDQISLKDEVFTLRAQKDGLHPELLGESQSMKEVLGFIHRASLVQSNVLILGETGTGKSLVAKVIHELSPRSTQPFVSINCASIAPTLMESELFGHVKGAFTGADQNRQGKILKANGGTLFLDEIGATTLEFQVKLLSVLQERKFEPVGSDRSQNIDVRIIAATNANLKKQIKDGKFREDLYYRLKVLSCRLPQLRERKADIPLLAQHFLSKYDPSGKKKFSQAALNQLLEYAWPGNVRELENVVEALSTITLEEILSEHLPFSKDTLKEPEEKKGGLYLQTITQVERTLLCDALVQTQGNVAQAAKVLGLNERSLRRKMQLLGIKRKDFQKK